MSEPDPASRAQRRQEEVRAQRLQYGAMGVVGILGLLIFFFYEARHQVEHGESLTSGLARSAKGVAQSKLNALEMATSCKSNLQADLDEFWGPAKDPTVTKCSGRPDEAVCLVQSLYDGTYKTVPFVANCSKRHFEKGIVAQARISPVEKQKFDRQNAEFWKDFRVAE